MLFCADVQPSQVLIRSVLGGQVRASTDALFVVKNRIEWDTIVLVGGVTWALANGTVSPMAQVTRLLLDRPTVYREEHRSQASFQGVSDCIVFLARIVSQFSSVVCWRRHYCWARL